MIKTTEHCGNTCNLKKTLQNLQRKTTQYEKKFSKQKMKNKQFNFLSERIEKKKTSKTEKPK